MNSATYILGIGSQQVEDINKKIDRREDLGSNFLRAKLRVALGSERGLGHEVSLSEDQLGQVVVAVEVSHGDVTVDDSEDDAPKETEEETAPAGHDPCHVSHRVVQEVPGWYVSLNS